MAKKGTSKKTNIIENNVENKKRGVGVGIAIVLMFFTFVIGGMLGYICTFNYITQKQEQKTLNESSEEIENNNSEVKDESLLKDDTKELVYTYIDDKINLDDETTYIYRIPQININSDDASRINQTILNDLEKLYNNSKSNVNANYGLITPKIDFKYYKVNDIVSVVTFKCYDNDVVNYKTYNINIKTGKEVSNLDLLNLKEIHTSDFNGKILNIFKTLEPEDKINVRTVNPEDAQRAKQIYQKNIDNLTNNSYSMYEMYLNDNNALCVIFDKYSLAGAEKYETIINLDSGTYVDLQN